MKKSLFAVAAAGAFAGVAGTAAAQSSVTVYGLLDLGYIGTNATARGPGSGPNSTAANSAAAQQIQSATTNAFSGGAESTNRLGFRGTEDIGGGLSAFFTVEIGLQPNNAQTVDTGVGQNRQTFVGLKKNGVGQFALGTQYTSLHDAAAVSDPGQLNNMMGNVIYDKAAGVSSTNAGSAQNGGALLGYGGGQNNSSYTVRSTNMLKVNTEVIGGFKGNAFYVLNSSNQNQVNLSGNGSRSGQLGGQNQNYGWGVGLDYTWQKLFLTANYQNFTNKQTLSSDTSAGTILTGAPIAGYYGAGGAANGVNVIDNQQYYAGTYDFGILKGYVQYINRKVSSQLDSSIYSSRTAQQIGLRSFITPTVESWVSGGFGKVQGFTSSTMSGTGASATVVAGNTSKANFAGWQIGTNYWLSKRTNLYAIYGQQSTSNMNIGYFAAKSAAATNNSTSYNASNYAVGVRHTF